MGRPRIWILPVVAAFLLLSTCGIEVYVFLDPPISAGASWATFRFKETTDNDEIGLFLGFELYYKLYSATPPTEEENIKEQTALISKGFKRVHSAADRLNDVSRPLIGAPPGTNIDFTVDFGVFAGVIRSPEIRNNAALPTMPTIKIRRGVTYKDFYEEYKHFHDDPSSGYSFVLEDDDVDNGVADAVANGYPPVTIVMYALSYGLKDFTLDIYSEAVFLGKIEVTF